MLCKNCKVELAKEDGFCQNCGARVIQERISLRFLFNEFMDKVLSVDNKILKTFFHLIIKPDIVINDYIQGVRKKYFNPVSYLLISITLSGVYMFFIKDMAIETIETFQLNDPNNPINNKEFNEKYLSFFTDYQSLINSLFIPVVAFISWLVFLNRKKYNFYEHVVIYLYSNSQISIISILIVLPIFFIDKSLAGEVFIYSSAVLIIYSAYVLIKLFKLTFLQFIVKTLYFSLISSVIFVIISIIGTIFYFMNLTPEEIEKFKKQQDSINKTRTIDSLKLKNDSLRVKTLTPR